MKYFLKIIGLALLCSLPFYNVCLASLNLYYVYYTGNTNQSFSIADASQTGLDITGDISAEGWIKVTNTNWCTVVGECPLAAKRATSNQSYLFLIADQGAGKCQIRLDYYGGGGTTGCYSDTYINDTNWHHIAATADVSAKDVKFYLDGVLASTACYLSTATSIDDSGAAFIVGADGTGTTRNCDDSGTVTISIDEVRVWNDIRTITEIQDNKDKQIDAEASLAGNWRFNDGSGNATDNSSNGNTLTNNNSTPYSNTGLPFPGSADAVQRIEDDLIRFQ